MQVNRKKKTATRRSITQCHAAAHSPRGLDHGAQLNNDRCVSSLKVVSYLLYSSAAFQPYIAWSGAASETSELLHCLCLLLKHTRDLSLNLLLAFELLHADFHHQTTSNAEIKRELHCGHEMAPPLENLHRFY